MAKEGIEAVIEGLIDSHGGVQGAVNLMRKHGFGNVVNSWVGRRANQAMSADQITTVLGVGTIRLLATRTGFAPQELAQHLARALPLAIDTLTPLGVVQPPSQPRTLS